MRRLDARCRELGIDLVPNQNSFGHLRYFLADPRLKKLGELSAPYEAETKDFLRRPTTLAPNHPGTLPFLRGLYDELLPNFSSRYFNVGCDETWDLGKGQSRKLCARKGQGLVYFDFLRQIHREVARRGKCLMVWGDIILKHPDLIPKLATLGTPAAGTVHAQSTPMPGAAAGPNLIALNWGYEANHPFAKEAAQFARAGVPFYVCPGTSTWQTLLGRHDNALANLRAAAKAGQQFGALGYLNTDWGDGGHPQPLTVSWPLFAAGAALAWNARALDERTLAAVLNRDIFSDVSNTVAQAALALGLAHQKLGVKAVNETPWARSLPPPSRPTANSSAGTGCNGMRRFRRRESGPRSRKSESSARCWPRPGARLRVPAHRRPGWRFWNWIWPRAWPRNRASSCCGNKRSPPGTPGKPAPWPSGPPRIATTGTGFQGLLAASQQGHAAALRALPALAEGGLFKRPAGHVLPPNGAALGAGQCNRGVAPGNDDPIQMIRVIRG